MFDALGMRGVWKRKKAEDVVRRFKELRARFNAQLEHELGGPGYKYIRRKGNVIDDVIVGLLSDTVVISVIPKKAYLRDNRRALETFSLVVAARLAGVAMSMASDDEPRWAYRGSISFGPLVAERDGSFFVGEAVDEAADLFAQPDGAFVCLTPNALERLHLTASPPVGPPSLAVQGPTEGWASVQYVRCLSIRQRLKETRARNRKRNSKHLHETSSRRRAEGPEYARVPS